MRKYYIFNLQDRTIKNYYKRSASLYALFNRLRKTKEKNLKGGITLYNYICIPFDLEPLHDYITLKYHINKNKLYSFTFKEEKNNYIIEFNPSCIVLMSNDNFPSFFKILSYYNKNLFICDFTNEDYFFLNDILESSKI